MLVPGNMEHRFRRPGSLSLWFTGRLQVWSLMPSLDSIGRSDSSQSWYRFSRPCFRLKEFADSREPTVSLMHRISMNRRTEKNKTDQETKSKCECDLPYPISTPAERGPGYPFHELFLFQASSQIVWLRNRFNDRAGWEPDRKREVSCIAFARP